VAKLGLSNSLVQTALKLTLPGMPDIYQGGELWDLNLVDPDNRRPVDYARRDRLLAETGEALAADRPVAMVEMWENWRDGRIKLAMTAVLLEARRRYPVLFSDGGYEPVTVTGRDADRICAFVRTNGESALLVIAARFPTRTMAASAWEETDIVPPHAVTHITRWRDLLTGQLLACRAGEALPVQTLPRVLPVAILVTDDMCRS
jgi:(1->4)-alpha-D-glucan 1-alpha-D-glucosylmutase